MDAEKLARLSIEDAERLLALVGTKNNDNIERLGRLIFIGKRAMSPDFIYLDVDQAAYFAGLCAKSSDPAGVDLRALLDPQNAVPGLAPA